MNKHHPYNTIIEGKLEQLPTTNADQLWNDMHLILDKKMPQKKERRRFIFWIFSSSLVIAGFFIFYLSINRTTIAKTKKLPGSLQSDKLIENGLAQISHERKKNITTLNISNQKNRSNKFTKTTLREVVEGGIDESTIASPATNQFEKYRTEDPTNKPLSAISKEGSKPDNTLTSLNSIHQDQLITTNDIVKNDSSIKKTELMNDKLSLGIKKNNVSGFYTGIVTGLDLSSIHFRSAKTGSTKGFIIGYAFNKKWSIESGLLWDTKKVYDNGNFFNPPGYVPSSGITIVTVNGKNRIYELPLNMKYNFISGKHNVFATIGLSSYLMRSENYDYEYLQNNQPGGHNYLTYTNQTKNWFSVVNFSAGYAYQLGGFGSLRIEPYLKLPLKDLGTGNMPIMSSGLNIGFTKKLILTK